MNIIIPVALCVAATCVAQTSFKVVSQLPDQAGTQVADLSSPQYIGDGFKSKGAGEAITRIDIWGGWAGTKPTKDTFTIRFHTNTLRLNQVGQDVPFNPPFKVFTGLSPIIEKATGKNVRVYDLASRAWVTVAEYQLTFLFSSAVRTTTGCVDHWISIASESGSTATFGWGSGSADAKGGSNANAGYTQSNGTWSPPSVLAQKNFAMEVTATIVGPSLCVNSLVAGSTATATVTDTPAKAPVIIAVSGSGAGPIATPWGNLLLSQPIYLLPTLVADQAGTASFSAKIPTPYKGLKLWFHALEGTTFKLTNGLTTTIQ